MTTGDRAAPARYRTDVQGLRAIGMALVVIGHIWLDRVTGGVDVFFVVSAFFMTGSLIGRAERGTVDPPGFWARVALRILPAAMAVAFLTFVAGSFLLPITLWKPFALNGTMAVIQLENLQLLRESTDYLARDTPASPFQQFWALSTQMQFFAILPLLILACARIGRSGGYDRRVHLACFGVLGLASFAFAVWILARNPAPHYFNPAARFWQFAVGAILAVAVERWQPREAVARLMGWTGLAAIVSTAWVVPAGAAFPGVAALLPVGGAALLLLAGGDAGLRGSAAALLSRPLLQRAAAISFTVYLCHWPILTYAQEVLGTTRLTIVQGGVVILLSILLAMALKRIVEDPMRRMGDAGWITRRRPALRPVLLLAAAGALTLPNLGYAYGWQRHFAGVEARYLAMPRLYGPLPDPSRADRRLPPGIDAQLVAIGNLLPEPYGNGCDVKEQSAGVVVCAVGSRKPDAPVIALVGGSHSTQFYPALRHIAERHGLRLLSITKSACPIDGEYNGFARTGSSAANCRAWAKAAVARVRALRPALVITTATRPGPGNHGDELPPGFVAAWREWRTAGIPVLAIRDNPRAETYRVPVCIDRHRTDFARCALDRASHLSTPSPLDDAPPVAGVRYLDLTDRLCTATTCPVLIDGVVVYHDNSHLSVPFVQRLAPVLWPAVHKILRD
ncbi:acyltransferase family protein [Sphingomonas sp. Leaf4]|uniref:acyltransferase family protein n=1 Tax=Sphingomonas sp. Leaf4 TaxID=2876553 RepID=UPI001E344712|nr:acyltransferase family protein [Sphingomonas sp. Leaf4]